MDRSNRAPTHSHQGVWYNFVNPIYLVKLLIQSKFIFSNLISSDILKVNEDEMLETFSSCCSMGSRSYCNVICWGRQKIVNQLWRKKRKEKRSFLLQHISCQSRLNRHRFNYDVLVISYGGKKMWF